MALLHLSINATEPERVARLLAAFLGGAAMPFPPFPASWIAFGQADDGTAIEVYPLRHRLEPGSGQVVCREGGGMEGPTFAHAAIASPLPADDIIRLGEAEGWMARRCDRGPFALVEVWLENRLLVEVLDPAMLKDYRSGMTMTNWARMFGLSDPA